MMVLELLLLLLLVLLLVLLELELKLELGGVKRHPRALCYRAQCGRGGIEKDPSSCLALQLDD